MFEYTIRKPPYNILDPQSYCQKEDVSTHNQVSFSKHKQIIAFNESLASSQYAQSEYCSDYGSDASNDQIFATVDAERLMDKTN